MVQLSCIDSWGLASVGTIYCLRPELENFELGSWEFLGSGPYTLASVGTMYCLWPEVQPVQSYAQHCGSDPLA